MTNWRAVIESALIICCCIVMMFGFSLYGTSQRIFAARPHVITLSRPEEAYFVWADRGLHGRVLYLFDRHINADAFSPAKNDVLSNKNYVTAAIKAGIVRKIFHVIPDASWAEVERNLKNFPAARHFDGMHRLTAHEGVPIVIMRLRDVRRMTEPALISINGEYWTSPEENSILELIEAGVVTSDLITLWAELPESFAELERHFEKDQ